MPIDVYRILNESPKKRLIIGFDKLKSNFNEAGAKEYSELYINQPLSFILENSRFIFAEPFYGYTFYKEIVLGDNEYCAFTEYQNEYNKVEEYLAEYSDKMNPDQKVLYEALRDSLQAKLDSCKESRLIAGFVKEYGDEDFEKSLSDALYAYVKEPSDDNRDTIIGIMENAPSVPFYLYSPYVSAIMKDSTVIDANISDVYNECENTDSLMDKDMYESFVNSVILVSKLSQDKLYKESVSEIRNVYSRMIFEGLMKEKLTDHIDALFIEKVSDIDTFYASAQGSINSIFDEMYDDAINKEDDDEFKESRYQLQKCAYESLFEMVKYEYVHTDDENSEIRGYDIFSEGTTIKEAMDYLIEKCSEINNALGIVIEATDEVSDTELDSFEKTLGNDGDDPKKANAPKAKNLANKIQFKAMDAEVKQNRRRADMKQKGQEVANAAKAVAKLPMNVVTDIKGTIKKLDEADEKRRADFMKKPGFRKSIFKNFKLAVMYGGAAHIKLAFIPLLQLFRHFSKDKDRRIRNEVVRELETEIKICEEKINDASSEGDKAAKYQLMRIKAKLESERMRVRTNSKYI